MALVLPALLVSLAVAGLAVPAVRRAMLVRGVVDAPDARRKLHGGAVPLGGGLAVFAGWAAALAWLASLGAWSSPDGAWGEGTVRLLGLVGGCGLLAAAGFYDDARELRGRQKLFAQILAALLLTSTGTLVERVSLFGATFELGLLAVPFTVCWLLGAVNAVNLLDGIDGLAGTVGVILGTAFCCMALLTPAGPATAAVAAALVGALLAFLYFNLPPARIFLGDAGSMPIGLVLGWVAVHSNFKGAATMALAAPAAVWAVPMFDVLMAVLRRKLTGRSLYTTDRGHLHHRLTGELNLSGYRTLVVVAALCAVTAASAVASVAWGADWPALLGALAVLGGMVGTRLFGSREVGLLARRSAGAAASLVPDPVRRRLPARLGWPRLGNAGPPAPPAPVPAAPVRPGRQHMARLRGEHEWETLWAELLSETDRFALRTLHLDVNHPALKEDFVASWSADGAADPLRLWTLNLPIVGAAGPVGWLRLSAEQPHPEPGPRGLSAADRLADLLGTLAAFEKQLVDLLDHHLPARRAGAASAVPRPAAVRNAPAADPAATRVTGSRRTPLPPSPLHAPVGA